MASRDEIDNWLRKNYSNTNHYMLADSEALKFCIQNDKLEYVLKL